jgi:hypothetical protein
MISNEDRRTPVTRAGTYTGDVIIVGWTVATVEPIDIRSYDEPVEKEKFEDSIETIRAQQRACWIVMIPFAMYECERKQQEFKRRLMFSLSGWLAPVGKMKRCGKHEGRV